MAYTTVADVKTYLGIDADDTSDDALLTTLVSAAQARIDDFLATTYEGSGSTTKYFHAQRDVLGKTLHLGEWWCSLTSVVNGDGETLAASTYITVPENSTAFYGIKLLGSGGKNWTWETDPDNAIAVTGIWGYSETAPADVAHAANLLVAYWYRMKDTNTGTLAFVSDGNKKSEQDGLARFPDLIKDILHARRVPTGVG